MYNTDILCAKNIQFTDHEINPACEGEEACLAQCGRMLTRRENTVLLLVQAKYKYTTKTSSTSRSM